MRVRHAVAIIGTIVLVAFTVGVLDAAVSAGALTTGSGNAIISRDDGLKVLPRDASPCTRPPALCPVAYAFAPDRKITLWITVRNSGPTAVTVDSLGSLGPASDGNAIFHVSAVLDGGDISRGFVEQGTPVQPFVLQSGAEHILGVELRTNADLRFVCEHWRSGVGVGLSSVPVDWHWLLVRHETQIAVGHDFMVMAPNESDCR